MGSDDGLRAGDLAVAFHTPLLVAPTTITLTAGANSGWATAPTVVYSAALRSKFASDTPSTTVAG